MAAPFQPTKLKNIMSFGSLALPIPPAGTLTLPHELNVDGRLVVPDTLALDNGNFSAAVNAALGTVTVTNNGVVAGFTHVYVDYWNSPDRALAASASGGPFNQFAVPPFVYGSGGGGGGGSTVNSWKPPTRAGTTAALPAFTPNAGDTVLTANVNGALPAQDGVALVNGDSLLVKNEVGVNAPSNGIYVVTDIGSAITPWILTRRGDADTAVNLLPNTAVFVEEGATLADTAFVLTVNAPIVIGVTPITPWVKFAVNTETLQQAYTAGAPGFQIITETLANGFIQIRNRVGDPTGTLLLSIANNAGGSWQNFLSPHPISFAASLSGGTAMVDVAQNGTTHQAVRIDAAAHTGVANGDYNDVQINLAGGALISPLTLVGGGAAIPLMRAIYATGRTYASVAAQTITDASTLSVDPPVAGPNVTITKRWTADFNGDVLVRGKLHVVGVIDPTAVIIQDPALATFLECFDGGNGGGGAPVSGLLTGRQRYNTALSRWEESHGGTPYAPFGAGVTTLQGAYNASLPTATILLAPAVGAAPISIIDPAPPYNSKLFTIANALAPPSIFFETRDVFPQWAMSITDPVAITVSAGLEMFANAPAIGLLPTATRLLENQGGGGSNSSWANNFNPLTGLRDTAGLVGWQTNTLATATLPGSLWSIASVGAASFAVLSITGDGSTLIASRDIASPAIPTLRINSGAHTAVANVEYNDIQINGAVLTYAGGGAVIPLERTVNIAGRTYAAAAAQTITNVATVGIDMPLAGAAPMTFTHGPFSVLLTGPNSTNLVRAGWKTASTAIGRVESDFLVGIIDDFGWCYNQSLSGAQDDPAKSSWSEFVDLVGDNWQVTRTPPAGVKAFFLNLSATGQFGVGAPAGVGQFMDVFGDAQVQGYLQLSTSAAAVALGTNVRFRSNAGVAEFCNGGGVYAPIGTSGMAIGAAVIGGTATNILFVGAGPVLAQSPALAWNNATATLDVGTFLLSTLSDAGLGLGGGAAGADLLQGIGPTIAAANTTGRLINNTVGSFSRWVAQNDIGRTASIEMHGSAEGGLIFGAAAANLGVVRTLLGSSLMIGTSGAGDLLFATNDVLRASIGNASGAFGFVQVTAVSTAAELNSINAILTHTVTFTADLATQREVVLRAPTYTSVALQTLTNASTFAIAGPPAVGGALVMTNPMSLWVQNGISRFDGQLGVDGRGVPANPVNSQFQVVSAALKTVRLLDTVAANGANISLVNDAAIAADLEMRGSAAGTVFGIAAASSAALLTHTLGSDLFIGNDGAIAASANVNIGAGNLTRLQIQGNNAEALNLTSVFISENGVLRRIQIGAIGILPPAGQVLFV